MLNDAVCLADLEPLARRVMTPMAFEYVSGGAGDERTLAWNTEAWTRIRLRPRVLTDVSTLDTLVRLLGDTLSLPLLLAPAAYHRLFHPEGELATARGAAAANVPYVVSTCTTTSLEEIAAAAPNGVRWLQIYIAADRNRTRDLVHAAEATGVRALCLTVDTPVAGTRNREQRTGFALPATCVTPYMRHVAGPDGPGLPFVAITWRDVEWLRAQTRLPVLLKGILTGEDAALGVDSGAAGIVVSNHGARNLDTVPASIDALPEVVEAVTRARPGTPRRRRPTRHRHRQGARARRDRHHDRPTVPLWPRARRRRGDRARRANLTRRAGERTFSHRPANGVDARPLRDVGYDGVSLVRDAHPVSGAAPFPRMPAGAHRTSRGVRTTHAP